MISRYLKDCEQEPLQFSGAIQGHGSLLIIDNRGLVSHAATNIERFFARPAADWLGHAPPDELQPLIRTFQSQNKRRMTVLRALASPALDAVVSMNDEHKLVIELFPHLPYPDQHLRIEELPKSTLDGMYRHLIAEVARITGFQRVMLYLFHENGDGEVINEARSGDSYGSYLGLRFPASDIPQIARALYIKNPWRWIPDAAADSLPIVSLDGTAPNLTYSDLRSVSPVHQIYLANMMVRASLSFPILLADQLAGLITCHNREASRLPLALLEQVAEAVHFFSLQIATYRAQQHLQLVDGLSRRFVRIRDKMMEAPMIDIWDEIAPWLTGEFLCDGVALCLDDETLYAGDALEPEVLDFVDSWFTARHDPIWQGDSLCRMIPRFPLSQSAGLLALQINLTDGRHLRLYLNRLEHLYEVAWGGNPDKPVETQDGSLNIAPRRSFEKWVENRVGYCRPWDNESRLLLLKLRELLTNYHA